MELLGLICLGFGLEFGLEGLECSVLRDAERRPGCRSQVRAEFVVNVEHRGLIDNIDVSTFLGELVHNLLSLLVDRSDELLLLGLELLLDGLLEFLQAGLSVS